MNITLYPGHTLAGRKVIWSGGDNPHLYISGQSGTGKSFLLKKLVAQAASQGALVLVLDYTSDFSSYTPPENLHFQHIGVDSSAFMLNPLIGLPGQNPDIRAQQLLAVLHSVFRMGTKATIALRHATATYLTIDESPTLEGLLAHISQLEDPGKGIESAQEPLDLLATLVHCGDQMISLDLGTPGLTVLDCSKIIDQDLCKLLMELILQALWNAHTPQQPPLILVLDEAQKLYWGASSMSIRILREGRKFGIAGWFSSQWFDHKEAVSALGQAAHQILFRPDGQHIIKLAKAICSRPTDLPQCRKILQRLRQGEFLWQQPDGKAVIVHVDS